MNQDPKNGNKIIYWKYYNEDKGDKNAGNDEIHINSDGTNDSRLTDVYKQEGVVTETTIQVFHRRNENNF